MNIGWVSMKRVTNSQSSVVNNVASQQESKASDLEFVPGGRTFPLLPPDGLNTEHQFHFHPFRIWTPDNTENHNRIFSAFSYSHIQHTTGDVHVRRVQAIGSASVGDYRLPCNWRWLFLHWYHHYMYLDVYNINERVESKLQQAEKSRKQLHSVHQVLTVERKLQHFSSVSQHRERAIWKHERQSREVIRADVKKIFDDRISA